MQNQNGSNDNGDRRLEIPPATFLRMMMGAMEAVVRLKALGLSDCETLIVLRSSTKIMERYLSPERQSEALKDQEKFAKDVVEEIEREWNAYDRTQTGQGRDQGSPKGQGLN